MLIAQNQYDARASGVARILAQTTFGTNDRAVYVVPQGRRAEISAIVVANGHTAAATFKLHHVLPDESSSAANVQYAGPRLANGTTMIDDTPRPMQTGESLRGLASVDALVAITVYGRET